MNIIVVNMGDEILQGTMKLGVGRQKTVNRGHERTGKRGIHWARAADDGSKTSHKYRERPTGARRRGNDRAAGASGGLHGENISCIEASKARG